MIRSSIHLGRTLTAGALVAGLGLSSALLAPVASAHDTAIGGSINEGDVLILLWSLTSSGLLLVGVFTLSSLGQQYYSMWLFPMVFTVFLSRSVFHSWPAWLAAVLFLIPNSWTSSLWPNFGRWMGTYIGTLGWVLLIVVTLATAVGWWRLQVKNPA